MKVIDIHTRANPDYEYKKRVIDADAVWQYVRENIDFELSQKQQEEIDYHFGDCWNNKIGIGGRFYWDEISSYVYERIKSEKQLIGFNRVNTIIELILTYIEKSGGFLD